MVPGGILVDAKTPSFNLVSSFFLADFRPARARAQTDRCATPLLLPRNVSATTYHRAEFGGVGTRFPERGVFDGGLAVAAAARLDRGRATDRRSRLRLSARLLVRWALGGLRLLCKGCDGTLGAQPGDETLAAAHPGWRGQR